MKKGFYLSISLTSSELIEMGFCSLPPPVALISVSHSVDWCFRLGFSAQIPSLATGPEPTCPGCSRLALLLFPSSCIWAFLFHLILFDVPLQGPADSIVLEQCIAVPGHQLPFTALSFPVGVCPGSPAAGKDCAIA